MIRASAFLAAFAASLSSCGETSPPVSVADVIKNIHTWNGKTAIVQGWLGECGGYDCGVYSSLNDAKIVAAMDYETDAWSAAMKRRLSIGYDEKFDRRAAAFQFKQVLVTAHISDECRQPDRACFDRASDLHPISIRPF